MVFMPPTPSYTADAPGLLFAFREKLSMSHHTVVNIPYFYTVINSNFPTILFAHGNAEDIGQFDIEAVAHALRANVCIYDYVGYGLNPGTPSENDCYQDITTMYTQLVEHHQVDPANLIIFGRSLGSGSACYLAEYLCNQGIAFKGLILLSPVASVTKTALSLSLWGDMFCNYLRAPHITCRTILIHGEFDRVVRIDASMELDRLLAGPHEFHAAEYRGHNDISFHSPDAEAAQWIRAFFVL